MASTTPTLRLTKQLSAGQKEMGLNFVLAASFSHSPRRKMHCEMSHICFLF